jgi:hypothetical protein
MQGKIIPHFSPVSTVLYTRIMLYLRSRLRTWLLRETYALPLDLFRILGGLLCVAYFGTLLWQAEEFSNPDGLLDHVVLQRIFWFTRLSLLHPGITLPYLYGLLGLACLGAWGIVLGYRVRLCAGILFAIAVSTYRWNFVVIYVDDAFMHLLLFWLMLLPVGKTLLLWELRHGWRACFAHWRRVTVPGTVQWCFLANICLVYLVAGLWKLTSPLWQQGFALYATLHLPIAYTPDFWQPQYLPLLQVANYLALLIEPVIPILLLCRPGYPLKWLGLLCQLGFHLGILLTLAVPFVNLGLLGTSVLFFRAEICHWLQRRETQPIILRQTPYMQRTGWLALVFLLVLSLAVARGTPVLGLLYRPAYAILWCVGIAQEYHLFDWIDKMNYHVMYRVSTQLADGTTQPLDPTSLFPQSLRATLLQAYLHNVRWMPVPRQHRVALKYSILNRLAQRFCSRQALTTPVTAWARVQRIRPDNVALTQGTEQWLMTFQCAEKHAILCRTFLAYPLETSCEPPAPTSSGSTSSN